MAKRICLDAGHYGKYNQSPVVKEYYESDMNWKLHLYLKAELEGYGFEVITTRTEQAKDLGLYERGYKAKGCDLFLSLHSNACNTESVDRVVVIAQIDDNKYDFDDVSRKIGDKLGKVIKDTMGVNEYRVITKKSESDRNKNGIYDDEWYGVLHGAKSAKVPGLILEHSFHTNTKATKWLLNDNNLKTLAKNEAKCIAEYFGQKKEEVKIENKVETKPQETKYYRVRLSWDNIKSQLGAYTVLENAKKACKEGYTVYDWNGKAVYSNKKKELKDGDVIKLKPGCTYYNGKSIPSWVFNKILYFRGKNNNGVIFSTLKTGAITGVVKEENVIY